MSWLLDFYRGQKTDTEGRLLEDILAWLDDNFEAVHDFIQWLFPLSEPSQFNPDAPLLTHEDIAAFKSDPVLQANLMNSFERILAFLGLSLSEGKVADGPNFTARVADAWASPNHNWLRISRILRSLTLLGMAAQAQALYEWLDATYTSRKFPISAESFRYWTKAVKE
jgi:Opioid growth factor receptor (OGFr) conserved region